MTRKLGRDVGYRILRPVFKAKAAFRRKRQVLFVCHGVLMADYLGPVYDTLKHDDRLAFGLLLPFHQERPGAYEYILEKLPIPVVSYRRAMVSFWDLILTADHGTRDLTDRRRAPVICFEHGIDSGKIVDGGPYHFGRAQVFNDKGQLRYTRMCVSSEASRDAAVRLNPALADTITVTGSMKIDDLRQMNRQRDSIREAKGIRPEEVVALVLSTWGPRCLYRNMGSAIVEKARELKHELTFILTCHPNEHKPREDGQPDWGSRLLEQREHFRVLGPSEEFDSSLVACDVVVTDHTSAAHYAVVLGKPAVFVPMSPGTVRTGSFVQRHMQMSPVLDRDASNLDECIDRALREYPLDRLQVLADDMCSFPGQGRDRVRMAIYEELNMDSLMEMAG